MQKNWERAMPLFALFLATFGIATTEFIVVGLLPDIAADLAISIPKAGLLVSGYALGVAVGGPILSVLTTPLTRKNALFLLMGVFVLGHVFSALAPSYSLLMTARIMASVCHASFLGIAAVVAASLVPPERSASAVSLVWLGFSAASLFGVPGGTALGHAFGWRAAFWAITAVGVLAALAIITSIPSGRGAKQPALSREFKVLGRTQVLLMMATSLVVCATTFSVFTYIAPILMGETGVSPAAVPWMLLLFGIGGTAGLLVGGRIPYERQMPAVVLMLLAHVVLYLLLALVMRSAVTTGILIMAWGFLFLAPCVPLQTRVVKEASEGPNLASTLNQAAFNIGNALGPWLGAIALSRGFSYGWLPFLGCALALVGVALGVLSIALARREVAGLAASLPIPPL